MLIKDLRNMTDTHSVLLEADYIFATARASGEPLIKFYHDNPRIATLVRRAMRKHKKEGRVSFLILGEKFHHEDQATRYLLDRYPYMEEDPDLEKGNDGMTIVCLVPMRNEDLP